ncbi:MAG: SLBB domain-containing protein, partial [Armatimonadota bacterium]
MSTRTRVVMWGIFWGLGLLLGGWSLPAGAEEAATPVEKPAVVALKPFGFEFFAAAPAVTTVSPEAAVPANYLLDAHDKLRVRYWTPSIPEVTVEVTVNTNGAVTVPGIGDVRAARLTLEEFRQQLQQRLREQLKNPNSAAELVTPRTISVFVTGAAARPGRYLARADANLFNVVYAAGGASAEGSLRRIALRRGERLIAELDAYAFLLEGKAGKDVILQEGDTVFFPVSGDQVSVSGQVARPAIYEILPGATVADALAMAGGLRAGAYARLLRLQRV